MKKCFECGRPSTYQHHVIPKSLGGTKTIPLCEFCHAKVHGSPGLITNHFIRMQKKKNGILNTSGFSPFGYKYENEKRVENKEEQETIAMMKGLYKTKATFTEVANILNERGCKTKHSKPAGWNGGTVKGILMQEGLLDKNRKIIEGKTPYGYIRGFKGFLPLESEQMVISYVGYLIRQGRTYKEIINRINGRGYRTRKGLLWTMDTLDQILSKQKEKSRNFTAPYGYKWQYKEKGGKRLIPILYEQKILRIIKDAYGRGYGHKRIINELNRQGYKNRAGNEWKDETPIKQIIKREKFKRGARENGGKKIHSTQHRL